MHDNVILFRPSGAECSQNINDFISFARYKLTVFGNDLDWEDDHWTAAGVKFRNIDAGKSTKSMRPELEMGQPFRDFAKAYFRYKHGIRPNCHKAELRALRCVERALCEQFGKPDPLQSTAATLDRAAAVAREYFDAPYPVGREIAALSTFMVEHGFLSHDPAWKNPVKRPQDTVRTGRAAAERREKKLPNEEGLDLLAEVFAGDPSDPRDIFVTSVTVMLMCAPSRIGEILALPHDCEVEQTTKKGELAYGWRFEPEKGGAPMIKWIPAPMVELAKLAINRIRHLSALSRRVAAMYEDHPERLPMVESCPDVGANVPLTDKQIRGALGASDLYLKGRPEGSPGKATLNQLNSWARKRLPKYFPWTDKRESIRYKDALFCFPIRLFKTGYSCYSVMLWKPTSNTWNDLIAKSQEDRDHSFFGRHADNLNRDLPLKITSHQFRHLVDTIARRGGLSESEIARWAGRADIKHNRAYNQISEFEMVDMIRNSDPALRLDASLDALAKQVAKVLPMTPTEFNRLTMPVAHITEVGFCIHDFVTGPCERFRDCANCTEQVCVKGDRRNELLPQQVALAEQQLAFAKEEAGDSIMGADRFIEVQELTVARLTQLNEIMHDPAVPDGSIVRLANPLEFSPVKRALVARGHVLAIKALAREGISLDEEVIDG
jgi:hypothetical protein